MLVSYGGGEGKKGWRHHLIKTSAYKLRQLCLVIAYATDHKTGKMLAELEEAVGGTRVLWGKARA